MLGLEGLDIGAGKTKDALLTDDLKLICLLIANDTHRLLRRGEVAHGFHQLLECGVSLVVHSVCDSFFSCLLKFIYDFYSIKILLATIRVVLD